MIRRNGCQRKVPDSGSDLIEMCDGDFKHHLDRYKYATRYEDTDPAAHRAEGMKFIAALAARLGGRAYLGGDRRRRADIAIFPFVRQFRIADPDWFDKNAPEPVRQWLARLMASDLFTSVMKKYPQWKETGEEVAFGAGVTLRHPGDQTFRVGNKQRHNGKWLGIPGGAIKILISPIRFIPAKAGIQGSRHLFLCLR